MAIFEPTWNDQSAYNGQRVTFNGIIYTNITPVAAPAPGQRNAIPFENPAWRLEHVVRVQDYYSLIETVKLQLKQEGDVETNRSIPYFIQQAEESFQRTIRVPKMQRTAILTADAQGRLRIPSDVLEPINLRVNTLGALEQQNVSIRYVNQSYEEWIIRQFNNVVETSLDTEGLRLVPTPVFRIEGDYIHIAPTPTMGTEYEFIYYGSFPQLGTVANLVNDQGEAINSNNQTLEQWIAAGNTAQTFVQATEAVTTNYFTNTATDLLLAGTLYRAYIWLKKTDQAQVALNDFERAKQEIEDQTDAFESSAPQELYLMNGNYQT